MQTHNLKRNKSNRKAKQVGRGGTRGKTSGKGTKGQNARAGRKKRPEWRDIIKRLPKLRGRGKNFLKSRFDENVVVKMSEVNSIFSAGELVNRITLEQKGLIKKTSNKYPNVKIVASGEITKALNFENVKISEKAKTLIEKAGGKVVLSDKKR